MVNQPKPSEKQELFIDNLLSTRDGGEDLREMVGTLRGQSIWTMKTASSIISQLLAMKPLPKKQEQEGSPVTEDGMYRNPQTGEIFKAQWNRASGDGRRLYAKKLVVVRDAVRDENSQVVEAAEVRFEYVGGAIYRLSAEMRMTLAEAKEFGALYGTCVRCGRTLTREESIERSMGPVCVKHFR